MPCYAPRTGWKKQGVSKLVMGLTPPTPDAVQVKVACQECIGCQQTNARNWAFRCEMELAEHDAAVFTTLTIENLDLHPTLSVDTAQRFLKRLRERNTRGPTPDRTIRHFLAGEYGTYNKRPHYHAILFGADADLHGQIIQDAWGLGFTTTYRVTPETIAYTAGYTAKKAKTKGRELVLERVNPNTGEVYEQQPEFFIMSRRPHGIGGAMRQHWPSWRTTAVYDGHEMPVPRYYHEAWKQQTTPVDWHILRDETQRQIAKREKSGNYKQERIDAARRIAEQKQLNAQQRRAL